MSTQKRVARKAVFLDRDGVIVVPEFRNGRSYAVRKLADFAVYPEAGPALERLKGAGFVLVVVTNQPDVGAGLVDAAVLEDMHDRLSGMVAIDRIEVCTHTAAQSCDCRKPKPGLLLRAADVLSIDLARSFMVGDRASDIDAGRRAGCRTAFRDLGYTAEAPPEVVDFRSPSLPAIVEWIISADAAATEG
ncbi:HAD family hydrolase [Methylobacterium sp. NEAU 140]|uniref:D-glycero-alpha-D-manno-heptose-1,7-bisphosphate 7-phosphatase n=1 Tax=Methylobacterium sp. NEAU 140 TaxID=3064945 RepID=UPI0027342163|nr:HAD family hydrolase [Methylobacterium sp. NEAU 140]MDP4025862.1 HAD family hydrolase [Methylobacterium sp. NEAU 140]